ncbi:unnamed protein product [Darwinula stevensoni]|uniref:Centrosomal protein CEP104 Zn finger domain-containing protein n=1 Tax=Darwinula stevensoni TaxID=69355 RepID=A0A7R9FQ03_9CRUS|nr:unnamed protein product [Darwinula stevensoni]CAG0898750.1 unnamed protein product [Darwinula stevensoni]
MEAHDAIHADAVEDGDKICSHCTRPIPSRSLVLHELHCRRSLAKCSLCGDVIPVSQMEQHLSEDHALVQCPYCHNEFQKITLEKHQEECPEQPCSCEYCDLIVPLSGLNDHWSACGSRTDACPDCGKYIQFQDWKFHIESGHASVAPTGMEEVLGVACQYCGEKVPVENLDIHEWNGLDVMHKEDPGGSSEHGMSSYLGCRFCKKKYPNDFMEVHEDLPLGLFQHLRLGPFQDLLLDLLQDHLRDFLQDVLPEVAQKPRVTSFSAKVVRSRFWSRCSSYIRGIAPSDQTVMVFLFLASRQF